MTKIPYGLIVILFPMLGCGVFEPDSSKSFIPPKGMKLSDIQPADPVKPPKPLEFQIFTYELSIARLPEFRDLMQSLDQTSVEVQDPAGLTNNSFGVGFGKPQIGTKTVKHLETIGGQQRSARSLIVFDEQGDDLGTVELPKKAELTWRDGKGGDRREEIGYGRLSWILKARPSADIRGIAEIHIEPGFRKRVDEIGGRMLGRIDIPIRGFPVAAFSARMGPGDFLLFGPIQTPGDSDSLSGLLGRYGRNSRDLVVIYLVICTRIAN